MDKYIISEDVVLDAKSKAEIATYYKKYLQEDMLKNWSEHTKDEKFGGYLTCFDRKWALTSSDKGCWGQSRHIFTFSKAYEVFEKKEYLELAQSGVKFVFDNMYDGKGKMVYLVSRDGQEVKEGAISSFSEAFAIAGLTEYMLQSKDHSMLETLTEIYEKYEKSIYDFDFTGISPYIREGKIIHHAVFMIALNAATTAGKILGEEKVRPLEDFCLNLIFNVFRDEKSGCILEKKCEDGSYAHIENNMVVNVGHTFEGMWFALDVAKMRKDEALLKKIIDVVDSTLFQIHKRQKDFLFSFSLNNVEAETKTWKFENNFMPTDNVSWSYAEAMCLFACLAAETQNDKYFKEFVKLHNITQKYFLDTQYGDWFHALDENFAVKQDYKGSTVKTAFHMPRSFMKIIQTFEA